MNPLGHHLLLDAGDVPFPVLDDLDGLRRALVEAARAAGATVVEATFHRFAPQGVSGVVVLAESHVALHTWPERGMASVDVFTCGDRALAERIVARVVAALGTQTYEVRYLPRGWPA